MKGILTLVIAKIKEKSESLFYGIPRYVTMDSNKWYPSLLLYNVKKIRAFEIQSNVICM